MRKFAVLSLAAYLSIGQPAFGFDDCTKLDGWFDSVKRDECLYKNALELRRQIADLKSELDALKNRDVKNLRDQLEKLLKEQPLVSGSKILIINSEQSTGVRCLYKSGTNTSDAVALEKCKGNISASDIWIVEVQK